MFSPTPRAMSVTNRGLGGPDAAFWLSRVREMQSERSNNRSAAFWLSRACLSVSVRRSVAYLQATAPSHAIGFCWSTPSADGHGSQLAATRAATEQAASPRRLVIAPSPIQVRLMAS